MTWVALGGLSIGLRPETHVPEIGAFLDGNEVVITAHVVRDGRLRPAGFGGMQQSLDIVTEQVESNDEAHPVAFGIRLGIFTRSGGRSEPLSLYEYGQRLRLRAKLHWPRSYRNPGAFDVTGYLADLNIVAIGSAKAETVELLSGFAGTWVGMWRARVHRSILSRVHALWPAPQAGLMDAMVVGDDAFIRRDMRADFQRSGTYHVLVVSGMNVGILAFVLFWLLRRLKTNEALASLIIVVFSSSYAFITDVGPPIWRATLMLTVYLGVRLLYRERSMLNAIGGAALVLLVLDPKALLGASFQLTFLAVLIIGGIGIPVLEHTSEPYKKGLRDLDSSDYDAHLPAKIAQFRLDVRLIGKRIARFVGERFALRLLGFAFRVALMAYETVLISALMQVGLALPMAWYFHRATVMGLPANLLVIPLTGILMPAAVAAVIVSYLSLAAAKIPAIVAGLALNGITSAVRWVGTLAVADLRVARPEASAVIVAALALTAAMILVRRRALLAWSSLGLLAASAIWIAAVPPRPDVTPGVLEVTAIDVGQADSTLLITPEGRTILLDAGGPLGGMRSEFDTGEDVVSPYLWRRRISRLDAVVLSHARSDHMGGMPAILANFRPRELWIGTIPESGPAASLMEQARELRIRVTKHMAGDAFEFGSVQVQVLWPPDDMPGGTVARNNESLVLRFAYRDSSILLEGDAEKQVERFFATRIQPTNVLKVGHNGSNTSTTSELIAAVRPRCAVISVGEHNSFGHPRREVLGRLENAGTAVYRTDMNGATTLYLDGTLIRPSVPH